MNIKKRAIFLDRDGVINELIDRGENCFVQGKKVRWTAPWTFSELKIKNGTKESLEKIKSFGFLRILVSNQPDVAYGMMTLQDHNKIMSNIRNLPFDAIYTCLHGREEGCQCKKPMPGMLVEAAKKFNIDFSQSFMIGDSKNDIGAARAVGCFMIVVDSKENRDLQGDIRILNLHEAVDFIVKSKVYKKNKNC